MKSFNVHMSFSNRAGYPAGWKAQTRADSFMKKLGQDTGSMDIISSRKDTPLLAIQSLYTQIVETYELKRFEFLFDEFEHALLDELEPGQMDAIKEWLSPVG